MPVLPISLLLAAADSRVLDSRGLSNTTTASPSPSTTGSSAATRAIAAISRLTRSSTSVWRRQNDAVCRSGYISGCYAGLNSGPSPGAVVGIVLGSIAGFLFILWLLWILSNGTTFIRTTNLVEEEDIVVSRRRDRSRTRSRRTGGSRRSTYHSEMRQAPRPDRIIRQERIVRDIPPPRMESRVRETIIVEEEPPERRVEGDDVIEVVEEHSSIDSPPPRRKSRRSSGYR